jgi:ABC-type branched-subunit amino acid transport system ATPase component
MGEFGPLECIAAADTVNLLAEQNAQFASGPTRSSYVIDKGQIRSEGPLPELLQAEAMITRHLPP